jgi:hypothetical protein
MLLGWAGARLQAAGQTAFLLAPTWVYDLYPVDVPGADRSGLSGINNRNDLLLTARIDGVRHAFLLSDGQLTEIGVPGASFAPLHVNDNQTVVGAYSPTTGGGPWAFQYSGGTVSSVPVPNPMVFLRWSTAAAINNHGTIVGTFAATDILGDNYRVYSYVNGVYSQPGVWLAGINDAGHVIGTIANNTSAFLSTGQTATVLVHPDATQVNPRAINNRDVVVGSYLDDASLLHGFVWTNGKSVTVDYPGAMRTEIEGVNDAGTIVGNYGDPFENHGFIAIPRSPVDVTINGTDGPVNLPRTQALRVDLSFQGPPSGALESAELYIGLSSPYGVWCGSTRPVRLSGCQRLPCPAR